MFQPKFSIDAEIDYCLQEIDRLRYRIDRHLIMPKHEVWLKREAYVRTAYASTMVEDGTISEDEMEEMAKPSPVSAIPKGRPEVLNYGRALEFVDYLSDTQGEVTSPEAEIRQIHWLLMKGVNDAKFHPGEYRNEPNWIIDRGVKVYEPPIHVDMPMLMREFAEWLSSSDDTNMVVKAGIAHAHLVAIHPFVDGNGRTARLLATLLLQRGGYGFRKLLSLDAHYQRNRDQYIEALRASIGPRFDPEYDSTSWLKFFTMSMVIQCGWLEQKLTDWRILVEDVHARGKEIGASDRQMDGMVYAINVGHITRKDYAEITEVSPLTATRDLQHLVELGLLRPEGQGRNRRYRIVANGKTS